jgi:hypothetical protein
MGVSRLHVHIITNDPEIGRGALLQDLVKPFAGDSFALTVETFWNPSDPKEMTWRHKRLFDDVFFPDPGLTHFLYLEDDMRFSEANLKYWLRYRVTLGESGFLPGFVRYEISHLNNGLYFSDNVFPTELQNNLVHLGGESFLTPHNPYAALYIVDKTLAAEYRVSKSFDPVASGDVISWPSTERSAMGLMFENPPGGRRCRFVVPYDPVTRLPHRNSFVHHLPNTFANGERPGLAIQYGSLPFSKFISEE